MPANQNITNLIDRVNEFKNTSFDDEMSRRLNLDSSSLIDSSNLLEHLSYLIAYSQQAKSSSVQAVIKDGALRKALQNFETAKVAQLNPCDVVEEHWAEIKGIRQQTKIFQIVMLARKLNSDNSIAKLLLESQIPKELHTSDDLEIFWKEFRALKKKLKSSQIPFFRETTSLLHLLVTFSYDCAKPDSAVMTAAKSIKIVSSMTGERNLVNVVKSIQQYSIDTNRKLPPHVLDLYFLVCGGQSGAIKYVDKEYYRI